MKRKTKKVKYTKGPDLDDAIEISNVIPSPEEIARAKNSVRVTMELDKETVDFFKGQANKFNDKYQRMIREVLKKYADKFRKAS